MDEPRSARQPAEATGPIAPTRRGLLRALALTGGLAATGGVGALSRAAAAAGAAAPAAPADIPTTLPSNAVAAKLVRDEFTRAWNSYKKFAWGHDEVLPVSGTYQEFFVPGHPVGLSIVEALDTLYVMELDEDFDASVRWIGQSLDFDIDGDFHVFEAIIRVVGGLLAGYLANGDQVLLDRCVTLSDKLLRAFTDSPTGMPYQYVNLHTGALSGTRPPIAEIGTNILEFGVLSQLTGDPKYYDAAKKAFAAVISRRSPLDLLGNTIDIETGAWIDPTDYSPNPPDDSFYEYLWGGWAMFGDTDCRDWFTLLNDAMTTLQVETYAGNTWYKQVDFGTGALVARRQSELAAYWAEVLVHAGDIELGEAYYRSWTAVLDRFPILPEQIDYTTLAATSKANELRPEYVNASFDLYWTQNQDPYYARTAWQYFVGMYRNARIAEGYTIVTDVTTSPMKLGDLFPAYSFAENFKYLYLMFARTPRFDTSDFYLSTEGKVLRGLRRVR